MTWPHRRGRHRYAWLIATLVLASCAGHLPVRDVDDSVRELRAEYLRSNPHGEFNRNIERGEVAPGMRFRDVLASWGIPDARERTGHDARELWTYTIVDEWSRDWVRYDFVFEKETLASWEVMRNVSSSHSLTGQAPGAGGAPVLPGNTAGLVTGGVPRR
ncbi:MAG TPA: hypothetical protein VFT13_04375 [Candidatus Krumholzibacteria bacterium]|nr:hypothetical protein [Candidatus Krumholzibacteria bacterium]